MAIFTIKFWRRGQWNYIPDEPTDSLIEIQKLADKYNFSDYHIMISYDKGLSWLTQKAVRS